jgi:hypothetical protein
MASNLPPGYSDETHSWSGFAAGNCGDPPFPSRATPAPNPLPAVIPTTPVADERLQEIRNRLAAVPGLPWIVDEMYHQVYSPSTGLYIGSVGKLTDPEIAFIVHASSDIEYLLTQLQAARAALLESLKETARILRLSAEQEKDPTE